MRAMWLVVLAGCASGSGGGETPDGGGAAGACATSAECDDGDSCTTDVCTGGVCGVSAVDRCTEMAPVLADDFESQPDRVVDDASLGGWAATGSADCPVGVEVLLDDRFDYGKPSAFVHGVGGWTFASEGGGTVTLVGTPDDPAGYSMQVLGTSAAGSYGQAMHQITAQPSGEVELRFWPPGNAKQKWFTLDEGSSSRFYLYFDADGQVRYSNGGSKVSLQSYAEDRWYRVRMEWDAGSDRVTVEIDNEVHANLPLHQPIARHISRLRMRTASASGLSFLVDDVAASGGDRVRDGLASLRIGTPEQSCESAASAARSFEPVRAGLLEIDLLALAASGPYVLELTEGGTGGVRLELLPDGTLSWRAGEVATALPGRWQPGEWLHLELRWQGSFDVWVGDDDAVTASGLQPGQAIAQGLDQLDVAIPPAGALWVDDVHVAGAP